MRGTDRQQDCIVSSSGSVRRFPRLLVLKVGADTDPVAWKAGEIIISLLGDLERIEVMEESARSNTVDADIAR
jgi:hypothetical protein